MSGMGISFDLNTAEGKVTWFLMFIGLVGVAIIIIDMATHW